MTASAGYYGWMPMEGPMVLLMDLIHSLHSAPMFPFFSTVYSVVSAFTLRSEPGSLSFAHEHPVASCVMNFLTGSSGAIISNLLLGKPLLDFVTNEWAVLISVLSWYLVFFCPYDLFHRVCSLFPLQLTLTGINEFARAKKIIWGVQAAAVVYPGSLLAMAIVGMFRGSGKLWVMNLYRLMSFPKSVRQYELLRVSVVTKAAFVLGVIFAYVHTTEHVDVAYVVFAGGTSLVLLKVMGLLLRPVDPFSASQSFTWSLCVSLSSPPPPPPQKTTEKHVKSD